jgi:hypothetical protein
MGKKVGDATSSCGGSGNIGLDESPRIENNTDR